jgi:hypothetical protein
MALGVAKLAFASDLNNASILAVDLLDAISSQGDRAFFASVYDIHRKDIMTKVASPCLSDLLDVKVASIGATIENSFAL